MTVLIIVYGLSIFINGATALKFALEGSPWCIVFWGFTASGLWLMIQDWRRWKKDSANFG